MFKRSEFQMNALNHMKQQHLSFESLVRERTSAHECMNDVSNGSYEIKGANKMNGISLSLNLYIQLLKT